MNNTSYSFRNKPGLRIASGRWSKGNQVTDLDRFYLGTGKLRGLSPGMMAKSCSIGRDGFPPSTIRQGYYLRL